MKIKLNQRGAIDLVLIVVVAILVAAFGGYVYYQQRQAQKTYDQAGKGVTVAKHVNPYAGWKSYSSVAEKVSFKYPPNWTFKESDNEMGLGGDKRVDLTSPGGFKLTYFDSIGGIGGGCLGVSNVSLTAVTKVTIPKASLAVYLVESGKEVALDSTVEVPTVPKVGDTGSCIFAPLLPGKDSDHHPAFTTNALFPSGTPVTLPANQTKDFATAKLILESLSYN